MKFCAVICEYDPFHNGHAYQFAEIRKAGFEHILCLMSGNFTQRGEAAVLEKHVRARHAVLSGADAVLELPAAFAVSPAELFARGGVHLLASLPNVEALAFGCESGDKDGFLRAARAASSEDKAFKALLKERMKDGTSYIRARNSALMELHSDVDEALLTSPNNILGVEYCRALLQEQASISPLPIRRVGGGYADTAMYRDFSSASALRAALRTGGRTETKLIRKNVPAHVFDALSCFREPPYKEAFLCALLAADDEKIAATPDCGEGLEHRLKTMARSNPTYDGMLEKVVSKRYTLSRLKRVLAENFLGIEKKKALSYLSSPLYLRVLAVKKEGGEEILSSLAGGFPLVVRGSDAAALKKDAEECFALDLRAGELYAALTGAYAGEFQPPFVG